MYISFLLALLRVIFHLQIVPEHIDESSNYSEEMQQATAQSVQVFSLLSDTGYIYGTFVFSVNSNYNKYTKNQQKGCTP